MGGGTQVCKCPKGLKKYIYIYILLRQPVDRFCSVCVPTFGLHARQCYTFPVGFPLFSAISVRSYTLSYVCYSLVFGSTARFASRAMLPFLTVGSLVGSVPLIRELQNKRWLSFHPFSGTLYILCILCIFRWVLWSFHFETASSGWSHHAASWGVLVQTLDNWN